MRISAFQGIRYRSAGEAGALAAPPFDQIDDRLRDRLHRQGLQFSQLTRPAAAGGEEPARRAARLHGEWLAAGAIAGDREAALYPYEILLAGGGRRLGVTALLGLEDPGSRIIRPHEQTVEKTVEERLDLLRATRLDLEPILMLADDGGSLDELLAEDLPGREPLVEHLDGEGHRHRLYRLADPERIARYRQTLAPRAALIADGHHRYRVARRYAAEIGAPEGSGAAAKLAVITSLASPGVTNDPVHRGLAALPRPAGLGSIAGRRRPARAAGGEELAAEVAAAPQPALGVLRGGGAEILELDPAAAPPGLGAAGALSVGLLHGLVLPAAGVPEPAGTDGTVLYRSDPAELWREVGAGALEVGFWLPPISPRGLADATAEGRLLPPKSTRFLPKLVSGLVWANHDSPVS